MAKKKKRNEGQNVLRIVWGVVGAGLRLPRSPFSLLN